LRGGLHERSRDQDESAQAVEEESHQWQPSIDAPCHMLEHFAATWPTKECARRGAAGAASEGLEGRTADPDGRADGRISPGSIDQV
jgi:hypothetical protein